MQEYRGNYVAPPPRPTASEARGVPIVIVDGDGNMRVRRAGHTFMYDQSDEDDDPYRRQVWTRVRGQCVEG